MHAYGSFWHTPAVNQGALCPQLARADIMAERVDSGFDPNRTMGPPVLLWCTTGLMMW